MTIMQACLSRSTAHGLSYIGNAENKFGKIMWLILTITMIIGFTFHTFLLYRQLLEENVLVSTFPDSKPFLQPDIVFCSERFLARDFINHPPDDEYEFMANVSKTIQKFDKDFSKLKNRSSRLIWDSLNLSQLYRAFFQRRHQLFLSIRCNLKEIRIDNLQVEMNFVHFACFRLNTSSCELNSPLDTLIVKFYTHIYGTNITYSSLDVRIDQKVIDSYLFLQKDLYHEMEDGIHVYLVQPNEGINEASTKITASVNSHTTIKVKSTEVTRLSTKARKCFDGVKYSLVYNLLEENIELNPINVTTESLCREMFFQNLIYSQAKCVLSRFPIPINIPSNLSFCGDIRNIYSRVDVMGRWRHPDNKLKVIDNCKSNVSCKSVRHQAYVNYNPWPRTSSLRNLFTIDVQKRLGEFRKKNLTSPGLQEAFDDFRRNPSNINAWKRNFIKISISPGEFMSTVIEESAAYSYKNFFSDVGGIMGFYLGASLLTLFELIRLMYCTVTTIKHTTKEEPVVEEHCLI